MPCCSFLVVVCGFAFCAEHIFGFVVADFHNFPASFSTLLRFVLGIFDYQQLEEARPALAPWFFAMHVFVMMLVVLNMFIAIVTKYFDEVRPAVLPVAVYAALRVALAAAWVCCAVGC